MTLKVQALVSQTVEPVRQPRGSLSTLKIEKGIKNYYVAEFLKDLSIVNKEDLDSDYPVKPFQKSCPQRSNVSNKIDRLEEEINKTQDTVNQLADQFQRKAYIQKCEICEEMDYSKGSCPNRLIA